MIEAAEALAAEIEAEARQNAERIEAEAHARVGAEAEQAEDAEERLERANRELEHIQSVLAELRTGPAPDPPPPDPPAPAQAEPAEAEPAPDEAAQSKDGGTEAEDGGTEDEGGGGEGARLIALNMALTGTPREETARYLEENFEVDDPEALLDDVYSRAG